MNFQKMLSDGKHTQTIVAVLLAIYILAPVPMPAELGGLINTTVGSIVLVALAILALIYTPWVVGILAALAAIVVSIRARGHRTGIDSLFNDAAAHQNQYHAKSAADLLPERQVTASGEVLTPLNQFPETLEEEVVKKMAPWDLKPSTTEPSYRPVLDDDNAAADVN